MDVKNSASFALKFYHQSVKPTAEGPCLLYNQCDGYHIAEAVFEEGEFVGFLPFGGICFDESCYQAWAALPDTASLYELFADKPIDGMSARDVAIARLKAHGDI